MIQIKQAPKNSLCSWQDKKFKYLGLVRRPGDLELALIQREGQSDYELVEPTLRVHLEEAQGPKAGVLEHVEKGRGEGKHNRRPPKLSVARRVLQQSDGDLDQAKAAVKQAYPELRPMEILRVVQQAARPKKKRRGKTLV